MIMVDLTPLNIAVFLVVLYYGFLLSLLVFDRVRKRLKGGAAAPPDGFQPMVVIVIPAHNEEKVIAPTLASLMASTYPRRLTIVMDDGSTDATAMVARQADSHAVVITRDKEVAGQGKGAVLNDALQRIVAMTALPGNALSGLRLDDIVLGVMDADGQLERAAIERVVAYFAEPNVGGVQIGVRIANATKNLLTRLQDMEFVGFSAFVQQARDVIGSVGLGGNGQFARLSALVSLGRDPWTDCLTEDLDLGLSLVEGGWRIRFCPDAFVAQQGLTTLRPLVRQRTRWVQGHYQCWRHIPILMDSESVGSATRLDLIAYLSLLVFVLLVTSGVVVSLFSMTGMVVVTSTSLDMLPAGILRNLAQVAISFGPLCVFIWAYQSRATQPFKSWELPAFAAVFSLYAYLFVISHLWSWFRLVAGRTSWAKTPRTTAEAVV